jgi:snRNA-activating protein complex subunit 3
MENTNKNAYPLHIFQTKIKRKKCKICDIYPARFITYGDKLAEENPFYYCEKCYRPFHYNHEGKLLYSEFEVYQYYHE